jgi:ribosomal protein L37AE/L43A
MDDVTKVKLCPHCCTRGLKSTVIVVEGLQIWLCEKCKQFVAIPQGVLTRAPLPVVTEAATSHPHENDALHQFLAQAVGLWQRQRPGLGGNVNR